MAKSIAALPISCSGRRSLCHTPQVDPAGIWKLSHYETIQEVSPRRVTRKAGKGARGKSLAEGLMKRTQTGALVPCVSQTEACDPETVGVHRCASEHSDREAENALPGHAVAVRDARGRGPKRVWSDRAKKWLQEKDERLADMSSSGRGFWARRPLP